VREPECSGSFSNNSSRERSSIAWGVRMSDFCEGRSRAGPVPPQPGRGGQQQDVSAAGTHHGRKASAPRPSRQNTMSRELGRAAPAARVSPASLVALLRLVDDVDSALAADEPIVAMAFLQGTQGILDFHELGPARPGVRETFDAQIGFCGPAISRRRADQAAGVAAEPPAGYGRGSGKGPRSRTTPTMARRGGPQMVPRAAAACRLRARSGVSPSIAFSACGCAATEEAASSGTSGTGPPGRRASHAVTRDYRRPAPRRSRQAAADEP
jgi:hypothetical protein